MLTEDQKRMLIAMIEKGETLPADYRRFLFAADDAEYVERTGVYALEYKGKTREQDILADTTAAPLQEIRSFNSENPHMQADWRNLLIYGDNLLALKALYEDQRGANRFGTRDKIKLIYIDPPFATKQDFMKDREKVYRDKLIGAQFIEFLRKRLVILRELLAADGSIYVHLDTKKAHYMKAVMDEVFGEHNFRNEIVWKRTTARSDSSTYNHVHDTILFYSKNESFIWNTQFTAYSARYLSSNFRKDSDGRLYRESPLTASETRTGLSGKAWKGVDPAKIGKGRHWAIPSFVQHLLSSDARRNALKALDELESKGRIIWARGGEGRPNIKQYADEIAGVELQSIWTDFSAISSNASEATGYPTQKPEELLERVISASSETDSIVLDAFSGSGTTLAVAEKLNRRWIGIDCGRLAIYTAQKRLLNLTTQTGSEAKDERREYERVEDFAAHSKSGSKGGLLIFDKAAAGELVITDALLTEFAAFLKKYCPAKKGKTPDFSLFCTEDKLSLHKLRLVEDEELKAGQRAVEVGGVRFLISFVEPKFKTEPAKPLNAKHFTLVHAGVYDRAKIRQLDWASYKLFVMQLFGAREDPHRIHAFLVDGYIGTDPVHVWNFPDQKNLTLDEGYVRSLHDLMRGLAGDRFYIVAPVSALDFMTDEFRFGSTRYIVLKVPESVLARLLAAKVPGALKQPMSEGDVNAVIDAVGFDFVSQPLTEQQFLCLPPEKIDLTTQHLLEGVVRLTMFRAKTLTTSPEDFPNFATLSMVMVDPNFNGDVFSLGRVIWAEDLVAAELNRLQRTVVGDHAARCAVCQWFDIRIPMEELGERAMVILVDQYGNEKRLEIHRSEFGGGAAAPSHRRLRKGITKATAKTAVDKKTNKAETTTKKPATKTVIPNASQRRTRK